jgi:hypothetical protein
MKVSGFTFIKNAIANDYPVVEAITSILPLCDEFIVALGKSDDGTAELIRSIPTDKIRIIETVWDDNMKDGGRVFAMETDKAFAAIAPDSDWAFYIQGDEAVHELDLPNIKHEMQVCLNDSNIEGLLFNYLHFYGSYDYLTDARKWYRREIRILKRKLNVQSYRDAQGFRINNQKIKVKLIPATIYHYGWVKTPNGLVRKNQNFQYFYDKNAELSPIPETVEYDYANAVNLKMFKGTHPLVMKGRIEKAKWPFNPAIRHQTNHSLRERILQKIYELTGIRVGEYKNYQLVQKR